MSKMIYGLILSTIFTSFTATALPLPRTERSLVVLPQTMSGNYNFEGIVALSNCSGSLIRLENSKDSDLAMVLTNGHCYEQGMPRAGTFAVNQPSSRRFTLLNASAGSAGTVTAGKMMYATMTKTDMTLYKLTETYAQILAKSGIHPLTLSSQHPTTGTQIEVISGYWKQGYSCSIEAFVPSLHEDNWQMSDSIRYSRPGCEVIGGTSGSPIVQTGTRIIVGVNNTINEDGDRCTMNNPCEIDANGTVTYHQGYGYAQETYWLYSCLDTNNDINLAAPGCMLFH
ncbi:MAG: trypsin-like peptidase domain-containing protein, partial [Bdellovibrionales bacterium]